MNDDKINTPADWLAAWDRGEIVPTVEMGGLGPGYEQAIQVTVFEVLRALIDKQPEEADFTDDERRGVLQKAIDKAVHARLDAIGMSGSYGLSGAQYGAACNLASRVFRFGVVTLDDEAIKDRRIQVSRNFPVIGETNSELLPQEQ